MTDEFLMLCVKQDELDKAAILYERYKKPLYRFFLYRNYNDREKSEDCVQQIFYRLIKYRNSYKEDSNFKIWIYSIARNIQNADYIQESRMNNIKANYKIDEEYNGMSDEHRAIHSALSLLPEPYRETLLMSKFLGMKYEEIAQVQNCSEGVIKTRVYRAIKNLREVYFKII